MPLTSGAVLLACGSWRAVDASSAWAVAVATLQPPREQSEGQGQRDAERAAGRTVAAAFEANSPLLFLASEEVQNFATSALKGQIEPASTPGLVTKVTLRFPRTIAE